jgi:hypothetical protein
MGERYRCTRNQPGPPDTGYIEASEEQLHFNAPHPPHENALEVFSRVLDTIKHEITKSRHHWDRHEPRMWSRAAHLSDHDLTHFKLDGDLVLVSSALSTYGTIILGKIRIPAIKDNQGEGFIHVRYAAHNNFPTRKARNGDLTSVDHRRGTGFMTRPTKYHAFHQLLPNVIAHLIILTGNG